ncbi:MAG: OmpA family protein [Bacteroidota bacterium]
MSCSTATQPLPLSFYLIGALALGGMLAFAPPAHSQGLLGDAETDTSDVFLTGTTEQQIDEFLARLDRGLNVERLVITTRDVNFETNSTVLSATTVTYLDYVIRLMERVSTINLVVIGHTDSVGDPSDNQVLSEGRATSVKAYLMAGGIEGDRIAVEGRGEDEPISTNETDDGRALNRRVEIRIQKQAQVEYVQDVIVLLDSTRVGGVILEDDGQAIRYRSFRENRDQAIDRRLVAYLLYASGQRIWINMPPVELPPDPEEPSPSIVQEVLTTSRISISVGQRRTGFDEIPGLRVNGEGYSTVLTRESVGQAFNLRFDYESEAFGRAFSAGIFVDVFATSEEASGVAVGLKLGYRVASFGPTAVIPSLGLSLGSARFDLPSVSGGRYGGEVYDGDVSVDLATGYTSLRPEVSMLFQVLPAVQLRAATGFYVPISEGNTRLLFRGESRGERAQSSVEVDGIESPWNYGGVYFDVGIGLGIRNW